MFLGKYQLGITKRIIKKKTTTIIFCIFIIKFTSGFSSKIQLSPCKKKKKPHKNIYKKQHAYSWNKKAQKEPKMQSKMGINLSYGHVALVHWATAGLVEGVYIRRVWTQKYESKSSQRRPPHVFFINKNKLYLFCFLVRAGDGWPVGCFYLETRWSRLTYWALVSVIMGHD